MASDTHGTTLEPWEHNHGHHMTEDGHFLFFNNLAEDSSGNLVSKAFELVLDEANWTATKAWEATGSLSRQLGDVQRLPNGNVLVTYSNMARIEELSPEGDLVQFFVNLDLFSCPRALLGYAEFRTSLYGPPAR